MGTSKTHDQKQIVTVSQQLLMHKGLERGQLLHKGLESRQILITK